MRRMLFRRPSPATVISIVALVFATTGSAVAAVSFARNAGAVDKRSAYLPKSSLSKVAGGLVATTRDGRPGAGTIPNKFLSNVQKGGADSFSRLAAVTDNGQDVPTPISSLGGLGEVRATCRDQAPQPGNEDPVTDIQIATNPGVDVNVSAVRGGQAPPFVAFQPAATVTTQSVGGSNTLDLQVERGGENFLLDVVVRQERQGTADAACFVYGTAQRVYDTGAGA